MVYNPQVHVCVCVGGGSVDTQSERNFVARRRSHKFLFR